VAAARPNVAIVQTSFDLGGTERQIAELIRRLDTSRFRIHVVCFRRQGPLLPMVERAAAEVVEFPLRSFKSPQTFAAGRAFVSWLKNRRIDVVQACDRYSNIFALPAAALAGVPLRIGSRRELAPPDQTRAHRAALRVAYRTAHAVVANSTAAAARLEQEGVPRGRIVVIPNGIDLARFMPAPAPAGGKTIATVANLRPGKGHDVLIQAMAAVVAREPHARLRLIGDGPRRGPLEALAASLGIRDHVEFLGHRDDVPMLLAESSAYAFPSLSEAFPNGLIEGMAAGLPTVATAVGGMVELVEHGNNGLLVPPGDAPALASAILELLQHPDRAAAFGRAARATIESRYSFERMVGAFEQLFTSRSEVSASPCVA
jgi:glycosyltransferase involved in cell wall biosynthesis